MKNLLKTLFLSLLLLALLAAPAALAASGDLTMQLSDDLVGIYNAKMAALDNQLYFFGSYSDIIYAMDLTTGDINTVNVDGLEDLLPGSDGMPATPTYQAIFAADGQLNLLVSATVTEYSDEEGITTGQFYYVTTTVDAEDETITCTAATPFEADCLMEAYDSSTWPREIAAAFTAYGKVFLAAYNDNYVLTLYAMDPTDMSLTELGVSDMLAVSPCGNDRLLVARYDSSYNEELVVYDLNSESAETVYTPGDNYAGYLYSFAYDESTDTVYFYSNGALQAVTGLDFESITTVCALPSSSTLCGLLLPDGRYAVIDSECVAVRTTTPGDHASSRLTIASANNWLESLTSTYYSYMNAHPETEVYLTGDVSSVLENMMNRDSSVDIYILDAASSAFEAIYTRGYMSEITSDSLGMEDMYDFIKSFCYQNGELVCYPVYAYGSCIGLNATALEKAGISMSDIPTDWPGFIAMLPELAEKLEEVPGYSLFGSWQTEESIRYSLVSTILEQYYNEQVVAGTTDAGYQNADLIAALEAVRSLDLAALGVSSQDVYEGDIGVMYYNDDDYTEAVLDLYFNYLPDGWYTAGEEPLLLHVHADSEAVLAETMQFALINPFSENREAAVAFLEAMATNTSAQYRYAFSPKDNEPLRYSWYEENIANYQELLDEYQESVNTAETNEDRMFYQELVDEWQASMDEAIENDWMIKPIAITSYQALADKLSVSRYNPMFNNEDASSEIYDLVEQLIEGSLSPSDFASQVDRKVQMMILEGN